MHAEFSVLCIELRRSHWTVHQALSLWVTILLTNKPCSTATQRIHPSSQPIHCVPNHILGNRLTAMKRSIHSGRKPEQITSAFPLMSGQSIWTGNKQRTELLEGTKQIRGSSLRGWNGSVWVLERLFIAGGAVAESRGHQKGQALVGSAFGQRIKKTWKWNKEK